MVLNGRFPHFGDHGLGYVYARNGSEVVVWADDKEVAAARGSDVSEADLADFKELLDSLRGHGFENWGQVHEQILAHGWEDRGTERYDVQSGLLLGDAFALATMADQLWAERRQILERAGGRHPQEGSKDWARWADVTVQRNSAARGARTLALASVEALVNELLAARHPQQYDSWELEGKKRGFWKKLRGLLRLRGVDEDPRWLGELAAHGELRDNMLHHRPEWVRDVRHQESVDPSIDLTQERLHETLAAVQQAVAELFALYGATVPTTHRPGWTKVSRPHGL